MFVDDSARDRSTEYDAGGLHATFGVAQIFAADGSSLGYVHSDTVYNPVPASKIPRLMRDATIAGRKAYLAGRMPKRLYAAASSPL